MVLLIGLVLFGPGNLPKLGRAMGETVRGVRQGMTAESAEAGSEKETTKLK